MSREEDVFAPLDACGARWRTAALAAEAELASVRDERDQWMDSYNASQRFVTTLQSDKAATEARVAQLEAAATEWADALSDLRQRRFCGYMAGEHQSCDCKYPLDGRPWSSEMTGCPELRDLVTVARALLASQPLPSEPEQR